MSLPHLTAWQWAFVFVGSMTIGMAKAGFAGLGLVAVVGFASIFGARDSTGVVLPLLVVADIGAVLIYREHARWDYIRRTLPLACVGVILGTLVMLKLDNTSFKPLLGGIILALTVTQLARMRWQETFGRVPHSRPVAWVLGLLAGFTTMVANAAGPVISLYCMAVGLPKLEVVGTMAWFFFIVNLFKVPFSMGLGLIHGSSLLLNLVLVPGIVAGLLAGRWLIGRVPQRLFEGLLLSFAAIAALRLVAG